MVKSLTKNLLLVLLAGCLFQYCASPDSNKQETWSTDQTAQPRAIWTKEQANKWYEEQPWLVGANFINSNAINQLEMFQSETFDTATIDRELGWAASLGMNTVRVYLHDLLWEQDSAGFLQRLEIFIQLAEKHGIKPLFVLFDSVWDPFPEPGKQRDPKPHVHNSGWVQNPGINVLKDSTQYPRLESYVKGVVGKFANDNRVLGWDVWNEPDNPNKSAYGHVELPNKVDYVLPLLKKVFEWSRSVNPSQPLTCGVWAGEWTTPEQLKEIEKVQLDESDVISFHNYENAESFEKDIKDLQAAYGRPILCTEYMARGNGSFFENTLPIAKQYKVAMYNWGLVDGKTQTKYPWDSWRKSYTDEPEIWFHDIFRQDGTPYKAEEVAFIKKMTGKAD